jgi:phosphoglycerate dehydrogenase-like enzyme
MTCLIWFRCALTHWQINTMSKPRILVARAIFPDIVDRLRTALRRGSQPRRRDLDQQELAERLADKDGVPSPPAASASTPRCWLPAPRLKIAPTWPWATTTLMWTP